MKKKNIVIIILLLLIAVAGSATIYYFTDVEKKEEDNKNKVDGYIYHVGYLDNVSEADRKIILSDYEAFKTYFEINTNYLYDGQGNIVSSHADEILEKYNEEFFKDKSLAVKYVTLNSGSTTISDVYGVVVDDKITIEYKKNVPEIGTMVMSGCFIIVEVPKEVKEIVD